MSLPSWPRPSTRAFIREARRTPGYSLFDWLHGYVYSRWPYLYISIGTGEHPLAKRGKPIIAWIDRLISKQAKPNPSVRSLAGEPTPPAPLPAREGGDTLPSPGRGGAGGEVNAGGKAKAGERSALPTPTTAKW